jgi:hypothetical protein
MWNSEYTDLSANKASNKPKTEKKVRRRRVAFLPPWSVLKRSLGLVLALVCQPPASGRGRKSAINCVAVTQVSHHTLAVCNHLIGDRLGCCTANLPPAALLQWRGFTSG